METGSHELAILSYATVCLHPSVSLNNEKICREFSEHKIAVCEKTADLRSGNSSDLNLACLKVLVPVEIFQFQTCTTKLNDIGTQHTVYVETHNNRKMLMKSGAQLS